MIMNKFVLLFVKLGVPTRDHLTMSTWSCHVQPSTSLPEHFHQQSNNVNADSLESMTTGVCYRYIVVILYNSVAGIVVLYRVA